MTAVSLNVGDLRRMITEELMEAVGAMRMLDVVEIRLILGDSMKIEEVITGIRVVKGCATVSQTIPIKRLPNGNRVLEVLATFDSQDMEIFEYLDAMARVVKRIKDVSIVIIKTLNGQPLRDASGKKKLVY